MLLISCSAYAQGKKYELTGYGKYGSDIRSESSYDFGVVFEWQPKGGNFGLNYSLRFGSDEDGNFMFQCPAGIITGLLAAAFLDDTGAEWLGMILCFTIPEGLSYNVWLEDDLRIAPFVNPLLLEFTDDHIRPVLEIGAKMKVPFGAKFFGSADFSVQSPYDYSNVRTCVGLALGINF